MMNLNHLPERMDSPFGHTPPNEDVFINEVFVTACLGSKKYSGPGKLHLTWRPSPRLTVRTEIEPEPDIALSVLLDEEPSHIDVQGIDGNWKIENTSIISASTFHTEAPPTSELARVDFHVANFVNYAGTGTRYDSAGLSTSRLTLKSERWLVLLDSVHSLREKVKLLGRTGGYAITHVGTLKNTSDSTFSSEDAEQFLKTFARFLSFVQGRWATLVLIDGFNTDGERIWRNWGAQGNSGSWRNVESWFAPLKATEMLPPVFAGYSRLIEQSEWREVFSKAAYWYVLANSMSNFEPSLIIAQASLELLAWQKLVRAKRGLSRDAFSRINADDQLRLLISFSGIPTAIPDALGELAGYARANNLSDGPASITFVRNRLVHPGKPVAMPRVMLEARQLALWYVELVLLHIFGYSGQYASRVAGHTHYVGQSRPVPWVT